MKPLWMPEGSVRSIIALSITGCACAASLIALPQSDDLWKAAFTVITFYFVTRKQQEDQ